MAEGAIGRHRHAVSSLYSGGQRFTGPCFGAETRRGSDCQCNAPLPHTARRTSAHFRRPPQSDLATGQGATAKTTPRRSTLQGADQARPHTSQEEHCRVPSTTAKSLSKLGRLWYAPCATVGSGRYVCRWRVFFLLRIRGPPQHPHTSMSQQHHYISVFTVECTTVMRHVLRQDHHSTIVGNMCA